MPENASGTACGIQCYLVAQKPPGRRLSPGEDDAVGRLCSAKVEEGVWPGKLS